MSKTVHDLFDLTGKNAVITGGAGLLGEHHAAAVAECGGVPILVDIDGKKVEEQARKIETTYRTTCFGFPCDITKRSELEKISAAILNKLGKVDILVNNAAVDPKVNHSEASVSFGRLEFFTLDQWEKELAVGLTGAFLAAQVFGSRMAERRSGVILNIASDLGIIAPDQRIYRKEGIDEEMQPVKPVTYSVIKHGIIGLTKYLATYWADKNVRVNSLCPGGVQTNQDGQFVQRLSSLIPLGRMARRDEYKAAVAFLVSDASSYMTGANLVMDGGRSVW